MTIIPVILSGGSGTRLWPLSVPSCPKQFLPLISKNSMIQETLLRLEGLEISAPIVICGERHRFLVAEQLNSICKTKPSIMLEPCAKNTAPAIAVGAFQALKADKDAVMVVLPSDHVIANNKAFQNAVMLAATEAMNGSLVTFGILPTCPHTGYGYIQSADSNAEVLDLLRFVEKPDLETAKKYLEEGNYTWNSGMFVFKAQTFLDELQSFEPEMFELSKSAFENAVIDSDFIRINKDYFERIKGNSIDYCVMEKTKRGKVIKLNAGWDDVGSWSALWQINAKDENGNVIKNAENALMFDTKNCYMNTKKTVATLGVQNLVIVESDDKILVADMARVQEVKKLAEIANEK